MLEFEIPKFGISLCRLDLEALFHGLKGRFRGFRSLILEESRFY
jgi:hypothetical protein